MCEKVHLSDGVISRVPYCTVLDREQAEDLKIRLEQRWLFRVYFYQYLVLNRDKYGDLSDITQLFPKLNLVIMERWYVEEC